MKYQIVVRFTATPGTQYYQGQSFLRSNLSDYLTITSESITLRFERSRPVDLQKVLYSPKSLIRFELQRALCFYLAVRGELPPVKAFMLYVGKERSMLEHESFTGTWKNCHLSHTLSPDMIKAIFENADHSKALYTMLTYWLKAQLMIFPSDRFRAAWTGFNALYSCTSNNKRDKEIKKLNAYWHAIPSEKHTRALHWIEAQQLEIWSQLKWYNYAKSRKNNVEYLFQKYYDDVYMDKLISALRSSKGDDVMDALLKQYHKQLSSHGSSFQTQLKFLVSEYAYFHRNQSFHGVNPYPLFIISAKDECNDDQSLCELLLHVIEDGMTMLNSIKQI